MLKRLKIWPAQEAPMNTACRASVRAAESRAAESCDTVYDDQLTWAKAAAYALDCPADCAAAIAVAAACVLPLLNAVAMAEANAVDPPGVGEGVDSDVAVAPAAALPCANAP